MPAALSALLLLVTALSGPALAQGQPLAIPADPDAAPPVVQPALTTPKPRPGMSPQKLEALRRYKDERLTINAEREIQHGPTFIYGSSFGGPRYGPHTTIAVAHTPTSVMRSWGIYQGVDRLAVPTALQLAGDPRGDALQATIDRKRRTASTWTGVAIAGGVGALAGIFGQIAADNRTEYQNWQLVTLGGIGVGVVGSLAGSGPSREARALAYLPTRTMTLNDARAVVQRHNDRLRAELGLSPQEVWSIEQNGPPGPR